MNSMITKNEQTQWYETFGVADAPAVILVHGSVVNRSCWQPQIDPLAKKYRVILLDLPGHGALLEEPFHFERAVAILDQAVEKLANGPAVLVGLSLGGHVATLYASRCPEKVSGLVISGASMNFQGGLGVYMRVIAFLMTRLMKPQALYRQAVNNMMKKWPTEIVETQLKGGIAPLGAAQSFAEIWRYDFRRMLARIPAPVLILNGENDRLNRQRENEFAAAAPRGRVAVVPRASHACSIENPAAYNQLLLDFLEAL